MQMQISTLKHVKKYLDWNMCDVLVDSGANLICDVFSVFYSCGKLAAVCCADITGEHC